MNTEHNIKKKEKKKKQKTNEHRGGSLNLLSLGAGGLKSVSLGWNQGVRRAVLPPEALGEDPSLLPPASGAASVP